VGDDEFAIGDRFVAAEGFDAGGIFAFFGRERGEWIWRGVFVIMPSRAFPF